MSEALRQFVLEAAGVRMWYARQPLPGAAPSPAFDFTEEETGIEAEPVAPVAPPSAKRPQAPAGAVKATREGLARLQGLLEGDTARNRKAPPMRPVVDEPAPPPVPVEPEAGRPGPIKEIQQESELPAGLDGLAGQHIALHLRFWQGRRWLLISASPDEAAAALEDRLAANILKALGDATVRRDALRWPVFRNPAVPGNDGAGAGIVLEAMVQEMRPSRQLWLGVEPDATGPRERALWQALLSPLGSPTVSFPRTLAALSSEPDSKRQLWQALRDLRG